MAPRGVQPRLTFSSEIITAREETWGITQQTEDLWSFNFINANGH